MIKIIILINIERKNNEKNYEKNSENNVSDIEYVPDF